MCCFVVNYPTWKQKYGFKCLIHFYELKLLSLVLITLLHFLVSLSGLIHYYSLCGKMFQAHHEPFFCSRYGISHSLMESCFLFWGKWYLNSLIGGGYLLLWDWSPRHFYGYRQKYVLFSVLAVLGFELRASHLLGRNATP
jgi:hypothetical protein